MLRITAIILVALSGCASVNTANLAIRQGVMDPGVENMVSLRNISSQDSKLKPAALEEALTQSLSGQGFIIDSAQPKKILDVEYISGSSPTWGTQTTVTSIFAYKIYSPSTNIPEIDREIETACTSAIKLSDAINGAFSSLTINGSIIREEKKELILSHSEADIKLGFPQTGTTISSLDAYTRGRLATECSIRRGIVEIISDLVLSHN